MDFTKLKFLVVDDSSMVCAHIESIIKKMGAIRVDKAENGKEAMLKIKKTCNENNPYALITLDWEMPEMSGIDVLRSVRADPLMNNSVILMVTSKSDPTELSQIAAYHPNGYIVKPFTDEFLEKRIISLLEGSRKIYI